MRKKKLETWLAGGLVAGFSVFYGPGCLEMSSGNDVTVDGTQRRGECIPPPDDGNPCTDEDCVAGTGQHVPAEKGRPIDDDMVGDCKGRQCDGKGGFAVVNLDSDVPSASTGKDCYIYQCSDGMQVEVPAPARTVCMTTMVCDGAGNCVDCVANEDCKNSGDSCSGNKCLNCADGIQNGDEKGVDCGGAHCKQCNGDACQNAGDCKSGFCADGVCCNSACTEPCKSCNLMGSPAGTCTSIPEFGSDPSYTSPTTGETIACLAADGRACSSSGACLLLAGGKCTKNADCISGTCGTTPNGMLCKGKTGEPCGADDTICASGKCSGGTCT